MSDVMPTLQGTARIPSAKNLVFGNLLPLAYGNLFYAKPDIYDGAYPAQIDKRVREKLGSYITPATQGQAPALPTFFTEVKGPDGTPTMAKRQACFDGVFGARGVQELRSFEADSTSTYDNNAYTITSTYYDGVLKMYTIHPAQSTNPENLTEYHMTQLGGWALTGSSSQFREGASAYRNARDWTKEQKDKLIAAANDRVIGTTATSGDMSILDSSQSVSQSTAEHAILDSETSADELSRDYGQVPSLSSKRLKREPGKRPSTPQLKNHVKKDHSGTNSRSRSRGRPLRRR